MKINYKLLIIIYIILFICNKLSALVVYETDNQITDISVNARASYNNQQDSLYYLDASLFYNYTINNDLAISYLVSSMYDEAYERDVYQLIAENYLSINSQKLGILDIGTTPTVYYNGFLAGWLDWGYSAGNEIIDSISNSDYLALRNASRSLFYTYQLNNIKIALQASSRAEDNYLTSISGNRNYGVGYGLVYALGLLQFSTSYLLSDYDRNMSTDDKFSKTQVLDAGFKLKYDNWYTVLGFFYDKNRWNLGNESIALNYILRYDNQKKQKWLPQFIYGYRYYLTTDSFNNIDDNLVSDNFLYFSLAYYYNYHFSIYLENKIDIRTKQQIAQANIYGIEDKNIRDNKIGIGLSYELF